VRKEESNFVCVYTTPKSAEIAVIKSLFNQTDIRYFVSNENLNILYGTADGFTAMAVMVEESMAEEARELLKDFISPGGI
jgi:hypothetical protein